MAETTKVIAAVAVKEGRDAWQGEGCCAAADAAVKSEADACGASPDATAAPDLLAAHPKRAMLET